MTYTEILPNQKEFQKKATAVNVFVEKKYENYLKKKLLIILMKNGKFERSKSEISASVSISKAAKFYGVCNSTIRNISLLCNSLRSVHVRSHKY